MALAAIFSAGPTGSSKSDLKDWPIDGALYEHVGEEERKDLNRDGAPEIRVALSGGGSGFRASADCVLDGRTGHRACVEHLSTPYSMFVGRRIVAQPARANSVKSLLELPCKNADRADPRQAAMWLLEQGDQKLRWHKGRPKAQRNACMTFLQAGKMIGGLSGFLNDGAGSPQQAKDWTVHYGAKWYRDGAIMSPKRVLGKRGFEVYEHRHALAIYDRQRGKHAWFVNYEGATELITEGFKLDRWKTIQQVVLRDKALLVRVRTMSEDQTLRYDTKRMLTR